MIFHQISPEQGSRREDFSSRLDLSILILLFADRLDLDRLSHQIVEVIGGHLGQHTVDGIYQSGVALLAAFVLLPLCYALSVDARPDKLNAITGFSAMAVVGGSLVGWAICHSFSSATSLVIFMMGIATLFYSAFCVDANVAKY